MTFTPEKSHAASLEKENVALRKEIAKLNRRLGKCEEKIRSQTETIRNLEEQLSKYEFEFGEYAIDCPYLEPLVRCLQENSKRSPTGRRYDGLHDFFALLSFVGPYYFELFHQQLLFPTYRTVFDYRNAVWTDSGLPANAFNGDLTSLQRIIELMLPNGYDGKLVLMIDAAYVTPYVKVYPTGEVTGLMPTVALPEDVAQELISDKALFTTFLEEHQNEMIKAEFAVMLGATDPSVRPFPICCIPATSGTASLNKVTEVETLVVMLRDLGLNIAGLATDGDQLYLRYSVAFVNAIIQDLDGHRDSTVVEIFAKHDLLFHFSDPYHLAKRDRYRKINGADFSPAPNSIKAYYDVQLLRDCGIPEYLLDNDGARKMEDGLPLRLFSKEMMQLYMESNSFGFVFCMLPTTLLLESLHSEVISRQERIELLMTGAAFVLLYYIVQTDYRYNPAVATKDAVKKVQAHYCFSPEWCCEYISATLCIAYMLATEESLHLGACGTHFLEHYFGAIRRHSQGEDTHQRFFGSMKQALLERILLQKLGIEFVLPRRRSDSGATVTDPLDSALFPLSLYLRLAKKYMNNFVEFPEHLGLDSIAPQHKKAKMKMIIDLLKPLHSNTRRQISTKSDGMTSTGGLSNCRRWKACSQLDSFFDKSTH